VTAESWHCDCNVLEHGPLKAQAPRMECPLETGEFQELYANVFKVGFNVAEFLVDFGRGFADTEARFHLRLITTPTDAKRLLALLARSIQDYEQEFGVLPEDPER
jgi:hypothetical protein